MAIPNATVNRSINNTEVDFHADVVSALKGTPDELRQRVGEYRNDLTFWVIGKNALTMRDVKLLVLRLDVLLQQFDF